MRFLFLVEGILLIIAITFLVQFRVITLEELSASRVSVKTRSGRSRRLSARPSPVIVVPLAGRSLTDFLPNYVVTKTGCRSGREEERKGKERREGRFSTSVRRIRRGGPVTQSYSRAKGKGERFTIEFDSSPWKNLISV